MSVKRALYRSLPGFIQRPAYSAYKARKIFESPSFFRSEHKPVVCFSFDVELAVGAVHTRNPWRRNEMMRDREGFEKAFATFEEHGIPATWAMCGHLFLQSCKREKSGAGNTGQVHHEIHPEIQRISAEWYSGDWLREDPCSSFRDDRDWYAPDIAKKILKSGTGHEIACHTFSHPSLSHRTCTEDVVRSEVSASRRAAEALGMSTFGKQGMTSFVHPYNDVAHLALLRKLGFSCFRSAEQFVGDPVSREGNSDEGIENDGILEIPQASTITSLPFMKKKLFRILGAGIQNGGVTHFWSHPWEFSDGKMLSGVLNPLLSEVSRMRDAGLLDVMTMKGVAKEWKA